MIKEANNKIKKNSILDLQKIKVSVVIPTFNSLPTLIKCIESVLRQTKKPLEIIVVDNNSKDQTYQIIRERFPIVKIFRLSKNYGVTGGRNYGYYKVSKSANFVLFFDHDMVADRNMLKNMLQVAVKDGRIGIVTPKIFYLSDKNVVWSAGTDINLWTGQVLFRGGRDLGQFDKDEEVGVAPACLLVRKELLDSGIRFESKYFATFEDTDFCFRAKDKGYLTYYSAQAKAYHDIFMDKDKEAYRLLSRAYYVARNRILFMRDFGKITFWFFVPLYAFYYFRLAFRYKKLKSWFSYLKGVFDGIFYNNCYLSLPFSYLWTIRRLSGDDVKTVLDLGCGTGEYMKFVSYKKNWRVFGVEIYPEAIEQTIASGVYERIYKSDVLKLPKSLTSKKFDLVFSLQVIEHVPKHRVFKNLSNWEKLSRKRILITTTNGFIEYEPVGEEKETNPFQKHLSGWNPNDFTKRGYSVYGQGLKYIWGVNGLARSMPKFLLPVFSFISYLFSFFVYLYPNLGLILIAKKEVKI